MHLSNGIFHVGICNSFRFRPCKRTLESFPRSVSDEFPLRWKRHARICAFLLSDVCYFNTCVTAKNTRHIFEDGGRLCLCLVTSPVFRLLIFDRAWEITFRGFLDGKEAVFFSFVDSWSISQRVAKRNSAKNVGKCNFLKSREETTRLLRNFYPSCCVSIVSIRVTRKQSSRNKSSRMKYDRTYP